MPYEALADRTAWLKAQLEAQIAATNAILTPLASLAALAAIPSPTNRTVRFVDSFGFFIFDSTKSAGDADDPFSVAASDGTSGLWLHELFATFNAAGGIPRMTIAKDLIVMNPGYPVFQTYRSSVKCLSLHDYRITELNQTRSRSASFVPSYASSSLFGGGPAPSTGDASFADGVFTFKNAPGAPFTQGISINLDPYVHNGALLSSVKAQVQGAAAHAGLPTSQVSVGVFRKAKFTAGLTSLVSTGDFVTDAQATTAAYQTAHALTLTPNQNNTIDKSNYSYSIQIWNEWGTNSLLGLQVLGLELTHSNIQDMRFP
ncbi:hypothetical protein AKJ09_08995 [Labilithrix luteola]|uniref:Uncharacterized protein n=1 Tax=Labilithrix luteola TaxID=1391654 RepID=A0A0K1Q9J6_9BACT|nr:hypothetical protein AKJ09_08995 [Labilithrix luteola]